MLELQGSSLVLGVGLSAIRTADVYLITCDGVLQEFGYVTQGQSGGVIGLPPYFLGQGVKA